MSNKNELLPIKDYFDRPRANGFFFEHLAIKSISQNKTIYRMLRNNIAFIKSLSPSFNKTYTAGPKKAFQKRKQNIGAVIRYIILNLYRSLLSGQCMIWQANYNVLHKAYQEGKLQYPAREMMSSKKDIEDLGFMDMMSNFYWRKDGLPGVTNFCRTFSPSGLSISLLNKNRREAISHQIIKKEKKEQEDLFQVRITNNHHINYVNVVDAVMGSKKERSFSKRQVKKMNKLLDNAKKRDYVDCHVIDLDQKTWNDLSSTKKATFKSLIHEGLVEPYQFIDKSGKAIQLAVESKAYEIDIDLTAIYEALMKQDQITKFQYDYMIENSHVFYPILSLINNSTTHNNKETSEGRRREERYTNNNQSENPLKIKSSVVLNTPKFDFDDLKNYERKVVDRIVYVIHDEQYKRIFNEDENHGGRWYGFTVQRLPKELRPLIKERKIYGEIVDTVEVDYVSLHPTMLYHKKHLTPPKNSYIFVDGEKRTEAKLALNIMINAKSGKESAISAIRHSFVKKLKYKAGDLRLSEQYIGDLVAKLEDLHKDISCYFYTGEGLRLQQHDSWIATNIMIEMSKKGIAVIPIHDSFIVNSRYKDKLIESMVYQYRIEMQSEFAPDLKVN